MNMPKKLFALLAIFCIIASAGVACAADDDDGDYDEIDIDDDIDDDDYDEIDIDDDDEYDGDNIKSICEDYSGYSESHYNETLENSTANANLQHDSGNANATGNITVNEKGLTKMVSAGNPVLLVLGISSLAGGYAVLRRN